MIGNEEILDVHKYCREDDRTVCVKCPHCHRVLGLEPGPFKGEQYQDQVCGGWLEVSADAVFVELSEQL